MPTAVSSVALRGRILYTLSKSVNQQAPGRSPCPKHSRSYAVTVDPSDPCWERFKVHSHYFGGGLLLGMRTILGSPFRCWDHHPTVAELIDYYDSLQHPQGVQ
jgi:hypothetical protein